MKKQMLLLIVLAVISMPSPADYEAVPSDPFRESYMAAMRRQTGGAAAEIRADARRLMYEICDRHHICTNSSAVKLRITAEEAVRNENQFENVKPFAHIPVWI